MEYLTLIGIVIIVAGFALKLDVLATVIISGIVTGLISGMSFVEILEILGSSKQVLPYASDYLSIILFGAVFQCIAICGNNFSRAQGNPKNAMISQLIGAGFNILFDYILIMKMK